MGFGLPTPYTGYRKPLYQDLVAAGYDVDFVGSQNEGDSTTYDDDHEGHGGATVTEVSGYTNLNTIIDTKLDASDPDFILLHIGTNDLNLGKTPTVAKDGVNSLLNKIYTHNPDIEVRLAKIILSKSSTLNAKIVVFNDLLDGVASYWSGLGRTIILVDMENILNPSIDYSDTLHPNLPGYEKIEARALNYFLSLI